MWAYGRGGTIVVRGGSVVVVSWPPRYRAWAREHGRLDLTTIAEASRPSEGASPRAAEFIRTHGGRLFVWASGTVCCGGTRFIEASTAPPVDAGRFVPFDAAGFSLFVRPAAGARLPGEVHVDLRGIHRRRVEAFWDGCAFLL